MFRSSAESSRQGRAGTTADTSSTHALLPAAELKVLFVRLKRGIMRGERVVGERERSVHIVPMPEDPNVPPERLFALCPESFGPGELELVEDIFTGAGVLPCDQCVAELLVRTSKPRQPQ